MSRNSSTSASSDAFGRRVIALPVSLMRLLEELVGRNGHGDLARLVRHEVGERKDHDIADDADKADEDEESEQTRHDRNPGSARALGIFTRVRRSLLCDKSRHRGAPG